MAAEPDADGWVESAVLPGFRLRVAWLFQSPLPKLLDVLADLKIL